MLRNRRIRACSCDESGGTGAIEVRTRRSRARTRALWFECCVAGASVSGAVAGSVFAVDRARRSRMEDERALEKGRIKAGILV